MRFIPLPAIGPVTRIAARKSSRVLRDGEWMKKVTGKTIRVSGTCNSHYGKNCIATRIARPPTLSIEAEADIGEAVHGYGW